jgi:hypothetical protein
MEKTAENVLYELWISFAEKLFERIVQVTGIDKEQEEALRQVCLRPNDFIVEIT